MTSCLTHTLRLRHLIIACLVFGGLLASCEERKPAPKLAPSAASRANVEGAGPLTLDPIAVKLEGGPGAPPAWLPDDTEVSDKINAQLAAASDTLRTTPAAGDAVGVIVRYTAMTIAPPQQPPKLMIATSIDVSELPTNWSDAHIERIEVIEEIPTQDAEKKARALRVIHQAVEALHARQRLAMSSDATLLDDLSALDTITQEQAHDAVVRLRAMREKLDDKEREQAIALFKQLTTREDPRLLTGVFAGLRELGATGYGALLVEAATKMSSNGEFPAYMALLAQMGEVHEPAVEAYLQSVISGHPEESMRQIASESLGRHHP